MEVTVRRDLSEREFMKLSKYLSQISLFVEFVDAVQKVRSAVRDT